MNNKLEELTLEQKKELFKNIARKYIHREGLEEVLQYIDKTDFYRAPASTRFHGDYEGGLVEHSLNVFKMLRQEHFAREKYSEETIAIVSLFHDLCKANFYAVEMRNAKIDGQWVKVPFYTVKEEYPYGHGEKSVYLLMREGLKITDEEAMAIRWHMGAYTDSVKGGSYSLNDAFNGNPLALELHIADMRATNYLERKD